MHTGILVAIAAAMLDNLAVVVQKTQAERVSTSGVRIICSLSRRPIRLLGIAVQMTGFGASILLFLFGFEGFVTARNAYKTHRANSKAEKNRMERHDEEAGQRSTVFILFVAP